MKKGSRLKRIGGGLVLILVMLVVGYLLIRPGLMRWGATDSEISAVMPGDLNGMRWTRAISINATPEEIYPWLLQWGQGRGGWYSYDWVENMLGFDIHSANHILPEFQNPVIGDPICMAKGNCTNQIFLIEPYQYFGWQAKAENGSPVWDFVIGLAPAGENHTRMIIRESFAEGAMPDAVLHAIEVPDVVMEQKAMATVKMLAEGKTPSPLETALEIAVWLVALIIGGFAGIRLVRHLPWKRPLLVGVASVIVLLVFTFLFPPIWLRGMIDLGLLGGLVWVTRE